jgi:phosphoribosylformylglycinamidine synthase subunit PurS
MLPTLACPAAPRQAVCEGRTRSSGTLRTVQKVFVDVMPKPEILDPQGQAVAKALPRLGFDGVTDVRQGKHFELEVDDSVDDETLAKIAEGFLSNPVIEDFVVRRA